MPGAIVLSGRHTRPAAVWSKRTPCNGRLDEIHSGHHPARTPRDSLNCFPVEGVHGTSLAPRQSSIHGLGLFADQFIAEGTPTWRFVAGIDQAVIRAYFRGAGRYLKSVVETEGNDVDHLTSALGGLQSAFKVMVIVTVIGIILGSIAAIVAGL